MTNDEYLYQVLNSYKQSTSYNFIEERVFNELSQKVQNWFATFKRNNVNTYTLSMEIKKSGSKAKGTAIKGKSDMDMFVSINDPNGYFSLKDIYDSLYDYLRQIINHVRKQNVSIGVKFRNYDIDVVPARRVNSSSYIRQAMRYNDHYLWSNKKQNRMLTNIQKHIDIVRSSGIIDEIILLKIWKYQKNIDFPSIYLEMFLIEAFKNYNSFGTTFENRIMYAFKYMYDNIVDKRVVDPSKSDNILSETLNRSEKMIIRDKAKQALEAQYWSEVVKIKES